MLSRGETAAELAVNVHLAHWTGIYPSHLRAFWGGRWGRSLKRGLQEIRTDPVHHAEESKLTGRYGVETYCMFLALISGLPGVAQAKSWPTIQPLHESQLIVVPGEEVDTPFLAFVKRVDGTPIYKLECHNGYYEDTSEINFSGAFQCALFEVHGKTVTGVNLLATAGRDEPDTEWWNRGRMLSHQLRGECLNYPEYSTLRHVRVRGMLITLGFTDVKWSSEQNREGYPMLESFRLSVDIVPDKNAQTSRAEPAPGPTPPRSCYP